jgi:hypothetical protein
MSVKVFPGSARASRADDGAPAIADFSSTERSARRKLAPTQDCFGEAPKPAREARALPGPR